MKQAGTAAQLMESIERNGRFCYATKSAPLRPSADYPRKAVLSWHIAKYKISLTYKTIYFEICWLSKRSTKRCQYDCDGRSFSRRIYACTPD